MFDIGCKFLHRSSLADTNLSGEVSHRGGIAHPYNVLDIDIVTEKDLLVIIDVDNAYQSVAMLSEIVKERRVLTHRGIGIGWIIGWRLIVAEQDDNAVTNKFLQFRTALYVCFLIKHLLS